MKKIRIGEKGKYRVSRVPTLRLLVRAEEQAERLANTIGDLCNRSSTPESSSLLAEKLADVVELRDLFRQAVKRHTLTPAKLARMQARLQKQMVKAYSKPSPLMRALARKAKR